MAGMVGTGVGLGMTMGILSPSLTLDLVALWPIPIAAVASAVGLWFVRRRSFRLLAIPGLLFLTWIVITLAAHLSMADWLPSASADVAASVEGGAATMQIELERGSVEVAGAEIEGYAVRPVREGGETGPPSVFERPGEVGLEVVAVPRDPGAWYRFSGWNVALGRSIEWGLDLTAPFVSVDVRGIDVEAAAVRAAEGEVRLGSQPDPVTLDLTGDLTVVVEPGTAVVVVGTAVVPDSWQASPSGASSPAGGDPVWEIVVHQGSVAVVREGT